MNTHHVRLTDILCGGTPKVRVACSCGVVTTTVLANAVPLGVQHIREKHGSGRIHYKDWTRAIDHNGKSIPVIGNRKVSAFNRRSVV